MGRAAFYGIMINVKGGSRRWEKIYHEVQLMMMMMNWFWQETNQIFSNWLGSKFSKQEFSSKGLKIANEQLTVAQNGWKWQRWKYRQRLRY